MMTITLPFLDRAAAKQKADAAKYVSRYNKLLARLVADGDLDDRAGADIIDLAQKLGRSIEADVRDASRPEAYLFDGDAERDLEAQRRARRYQAANSANAVPERRATWPPRVHEAVADIDRGIDARLAKHRGMIADAESQGHLYFAPVAGSLEAFARGDRDGTALQKYRFVRHPMQDASEFDRLLQIVMRASAPMKSR